MRNSSWCRFNNDVRYDILVSPYGYDYYNMTVKQAADNFAWFLSVIPQRMNYFRTRCASDLNISLNNLDYSAESMIIIWKWFLSTAQMEKTPREILEKMKERASVFGNSYINEEQFTVASQFMMKDIGMYIGQSYILNYPQLHWSFYTKPRNEINAKQPVIEGFFFHDDNTQGAISLNPLSLAEGAAQKIYSKTQSETDVYDYYIQWLKWIAK